MDLAMPKLTFTLGVLSVLCKAFLVGAAPNLLPIYTLLQFPVLLTLVVRAWSKSKQLLYLCEFCWIANIVGWSYIAMEVAFTTKVIHTIPLDQETRVWLARHLILTLSPD